MRKLTKIILPEVGVENLKIRSRDDNRCESAKFARIVDRGCVRQSGPWPLMQCATRTGNKSCCLMCEGRWKDSVGPPLTESYFK